MISWPSSLRSKFPIKLSLPKRLSWVEIDDFFFFCQLELNIPYSSKLRDLLSFVKEEWKLWNRNRKDRICGPAVCLPWKGRCGFRRADGAWQGDVCTSYCYQCWNTLTGADGSSLPDTSEWYHARDKLLSRHCTLILKSRQDYEYRNIQSLCGFLKTRNRPVYIYALFIIIISKSWHDRQVKERSSQDWLHVYIWHVLLKLYSNLTIWDRIIGGVWSKCTRVPRLMSIGQKDAVVL